MRYRQSTTRFFRTLHQYLGLFAALFVLIVSVTGILINHGHRLGLDKQKVTLTFLLDHYGIAAPASVRVFQTQPDLLAIADDQWLINDHLIADNSNDLIAIMPFRDMFLAVSRNELFLLSGEGHKLEIQDGSTGLPQDIQRLGKTDRIWLQTGHGVFVSDNDLIEWQKAEAPEDLNWIAELPSDRKTRQKITGQVRSTHLTREQVIIDLHSGRLFGISGVIFTDLVALALCFLALTGVYVWVRKR